MGKKNKHIPFTICDRCIAIREAKKNNDFKAYCEAIGITEQIKLAEKYLEDHKGEQETEEYLSTDQYLIEQQFEFKSKSAILPPNSCPFNFKPNLKIAIRRKYRLKCCHCNELFGCPAYAIRINKETPPMCYDCVSDLASPDDYSPEEDNWGPDEFLGGF